MSRPASDWDEAAAFDVVEARGLGATARAAVRPAPRHAPQPAPRPRRVIRWGQMAAVVLVGYLVAVGGSSELSYLRVAHDASTLAVQAATLSAENRSLTHQIALLHQTRYVDELARTEMGYTSPGEQELVPRSEKSTTSAG